MALICACSHRFVTASREQAFLDWQRVPACGVGAMVFAIFRDVSAARRLTHIPLQRGRCRRLRCGAITV